MHPELKVSFNKQFESKQPLVLIVDDDRDNLLLASCVIESLGMRYVVTDNPEKCFNLVSTLLPDIVLLDIVMPELNGLQITRKLKEDKDIASIPVIAVTGLTSIKDRQEIFAAGCNDYLSKPYLIEELESKVWLYLNSD